MTKTWLSGLLTLSLWLAASAASSQAIVVGQPLPQVSIDDRGELLLEQEEVIFAAWQSPLQPGKAHVLQYMAGTVSASKINEPFTERLKIEEELDILFTTVINLDDATWGTSGFVVSEVKKNKRMFPLSRLVLDEEGTGRDAWDLPRKSSAIVVTDASGVVQYVKQGPMDEAEIERVLEMLRSMDSQDSAS